MTINRVGSGISPLSDYRNGKTTKDAKAVSVKASDKLEISKEAKVKSSEISDTNKLTLVKERIDSGFYNKEEVIGSVADSILKEIRGA
ncbi:MAG: hypothetical protein PF445_04730 [Melioribacteraceae bacterium]|jgi:hypothetical protein|nr:hypothetical protein [Melioribacteraceae bacterium]